MWTYRQASGAFINPKGVIRGIGYAGHGPGVNNPALQNVANVGPLPAGRYTMTEWREDDPHTGLGTIVLTPHPDNEMFGRSAFRIHGDDGTGKRTASHGCIVWGHLEDRRGVWLSGDRELLVTG